MLPDKIFYEKHIFEYPLGKMLQEKFKDCSWTEIESHNNIEMLRKNPNSDFPKMKKYIIIGTRKTHKYVPNKKISDYLVPWTSSGCSASCLYCYLVCNYNKCAYLRLFVNREQMMDKLKKNALKSPNSVFEIGSNSDLVLENTITGNLRWTIQEFVKIESAKITFPTKFDMIDDILDIDHKGRVIVRMSVNPQEIITKVEFGTSKLLDRINAINKLCDAGYKVGILIAPVIFVENWKEKYTELLDILYYKLSDKVKQQVQFEIIFMTYSFVQRAINTDAFPKAIDLYSKEKMTGRGMGKYCYKQDLRADGEIFFRGEIPLRFGEGRIFYIV